MLVRLVPIRAGRLNRFAFTNLWIDERSPAKLTLGGIIHPATEARFEAYDGGVAVRAHKGSVTVNGVLVDSPQRLIDGDIVALRDKASESAYGFEEDLSGIKAARRDWEARSGIQRLPPESTANERAVKALRKRVIFDETGVTLRRSLGRTRSLPWDEIDAVVFSPQTHLAQTTDALEAMMTGFSEGLKSADSYAKDRSESDRDPVFHAAAYTVRFMWGPREQASLENVDRATCALLAQAIEYYAPIDLTTFGT